MSVESLLYEVRELFGAHLRPLLDSFNGFVIATQLWRGLSFIEGDFTPKNNLTVIFLLNNWFEGAFIVYDRLLLFFHQFSELVHVLTFLPRELMEAREGNTLARRNLFLIFG